MPTLLAVAISRSEIPRDSRKRLRSGPVTGSGSTTTGARSGPGETAGAGAKAGTLAGETRPSDTSYSCRRAASRSTA
jgi:hypothetical protein